MEYGAVNWQRSLARAQAEAKRRRRPLLILFTEVPGCSTVRGYAQRVLRHPLIVEAAETLFVPLLIHNNTPGADARSLRRFSEASWNNPALRIVDSDLRPLAPRLYGDYTVGATAATMRKALKKAGGVVPRYVGLLAAEGTSKIAIAAYATTCFWSGEAHFGALDGVLTTKAGFSHGQEVVALRYDPARLSAKDLERHGKRIGAQALSARHIAAAPAKDQLYYLKKSPWRRVGSLTRLQRVKINAALARGKSGKSYASPRQLAVLARAHLKIPDRARRANRRRWLGARRAHTGGMQPPSNNASGVEGPSWRREGL